MSTLNHNLEQTHNFKPLRIEGKIPHQLRGTLYRTGPGLVEKFGNKIHPFVATQRRSCLGTPALGRRIIND